MRAELNMGGNIPAMDNERPRELQATEEELSASEYELSSGVPRNFFRGRIQQIQLRTEYREEGYLGMVAP